MTIFEIIMTNAFKRVQKFQKFEKANTFLLSKIYFPFPIIIHQHAIMHAPFKNLIKPKNHCMFLSRIHSTRHATSLCGRVLSI